MTMQTLASPHVFFLDFLMPAGGYASASEEAQGELQPIGGARKMLRWQCQYKKLRFGDGNDTDYPSMRLRSVRSDLWKLNIFSNDVHNLLFK